MTRSTVRLPMTVLRRATSPPLLLLHGFCAAAAGWLPTMERLAGNFDVIAPEWPGFGTSVERAPCTSIDAMAERVIALADALCLGRFHVLGHSMSGFVVQQLLLRHPQRIGKAVLYGAGLLTSRDGRFETLQATIERLRREGVHATARKVCATWFVEQERAASYAACVDQGAGMDAEAGIAALTACETIDFSDRLGGVDNEVLVILGDRDRTFRVGDAVQLAAALPNASLCVLPGCAHAAHLEQPELFGQVVDGFLNSL